METASTYFTRRAQQERASAADAASAESRKAHLELALRLVRVAIEPALWAWRGAASERHLPNDGATNIGHALAGAFPLPPAGTFESLLDGVGTDES
jgi:hypothetical protein